MLVSLKLTSYDVVSVSLVAAHNVHAWRKYLKCGRSTASEDCCGPSDVDHWTGRARGRAVRSDQQQKALRGFTTAAWLSITKKVEKEW